MSERMTEAEFNSLLIRRVNRDGTAERLCSVAHAEITTLRAEVSELNQVFDARWSADMRAIKCWRKVTPGNELVLPDHVDLSLWLMEERTRLTAEVERLRADIAYADKHAEKVESLLWGTAKEREKLRAALERLLRAKNEKDAHGDTPVYQALKAGAWDEARAVITQESTNAEV